jgi:hypothetical protein
VVVTGAEALPIAASRKPDVAGPPLTVTARQGYLLEEPRG